MSFINLVIKSKLIHNSGDIEICFTIISNKYLMNDLLILMNGISPRTKDVHYDGLNSVYLYSPFNERTFLKGKRTKVLQKYLLTNISVL